MLKKHLICDVSENSVAKKLGIIPGDILVSINGKEIIDFFDYNILIADENILITIEKPSGENVELNIEKAEYDNLGLTFENYLMDESKSCNNKCLFCFIDQLPKGMRKSLYYKDDDLRLSFLSGNYVTLTNVSDKELDRLISYKLSPMNISVHTTNTELRVKMLNNKNAGRIMEQLRKIAAAGIDINCQVVLCPQINDGEALNQTISDLMSLGGKIISIAIVPVGLTKYRAENSLQNILPVGQSTAKKTIEAIINWQQVFYQKRKDNIIYAADELYIKAGMNFPSLESYGDLPQLENGVGMIPLFIEEMNNGIKKRLKKRDKSKTDKSKKSVNNNEIENKTDKVEYIISKNNEYNSDGSIFIVTGKDASSYISKYDAQLSDLYKSEIKTKYIPNKYFGDNVTVAGLVTGKDIADSLKKDKDFGNCNAIIIPTCMLRFGETVFLDDTTVEDLKENLGINVLCVEPDAKGLLTLLDKLNRNKL